MRFELRWPLADQAQAAPAPRPLVLDTNIVLDLLVFNDPAIAPVRQLLADCALRWIATPVMRDELARVLAYPQIAPRVAYYGLQAEAVVQSYEAQVQWCAEPPRVPAACKDADDQKFIDLAAAHAAVLLSKDKAVLCMRKRLQAHGAEVGTALVMAPAQAV